MLANTGHRLRCGLASAGFVEPSPLGGAERPQSSPPLPSNSARLPSRRVARQRRLSVKTSGHDHSGGAGAWHPFRCGLEGAPLRGETGGAPAPYAAGRAGSPSNAGERYTRGGRRSFLGRVSASNDSGSRAAPLKPRRETSPRGVESPHGQPGKDPQVAWARREALNRSHGRL